MRPRKIEVSNLRSCDWMRCGRKISSHDSKERIAFARERHDTSGFLTACPWRAFAFFRQSKFKDSVGRRATVGDELHSAGAFSISSRETLSYRNALERFLITIEAA